MFSCLKKALDWDSAWKEAKTRRWVISPWSLKRFLLVSSYFFVGNLKKKENFLLGGIAEKSGLLKAGDEILDVNGVDVSQMSRIEAWKLMKRIPDGNVSITIRRLL